ncbi:tRNA 2-thiouridine(34) synthase MnmA [Candidatus Saccharibacteria bacterium QS_5_54_17]|nr:MAG: tRNA 2-thiouridine(34) synthase MnmA [Candidatus Saccharibacteria bacterium QS_5_54_17]
MSHIFVGMSGGVDSSVAAALCQEQGYEVTGVYMKNWTRDVGGVECPWRQDLADAQSVAAQLDIPFKIFDFETEYKDRVVDYMLDEYRAGRTPNPDIMCNQEVKFKLFFETALEEGADAIAMGHYARAWDGRLYAGVDTQKDQSYFLHRLKSDVLARTIFPLGGYSKDAVRKRAAERDLPTASKPDSQGICFIGEVDIKTFLADYIETEPGPIKHYTTGAVLGEHAGAAFYTIGQRHGLHVGGALSNSNHDGLPLYVLSKDMAENTVYVTENLTALMEDTFIIGDTHWINEPPRTAGDAYYVRTRHGGRLTPATVDNVDEQTAEIRLAQPERALTAGQFAVVYEDAPEGLRVAGGGIIRA